MVPKTPIAWRRRQAADTSNTQDFLFLFATADVRLKALESWAWGGRSKAPEVLKRWTDERTAELRLEILGEA